MKHFFSLLLVIVLAGLVIVGCGGNAPKTNPFVIGQTVYPKSDFVLTASAEQFAKMAQGAKVINTSSDLIRVRFSDNTEGVYGWVWFIAKEPLVLTEDWVLGNPFSTGQTVCAVPDSVRESFPDKGIVTEIHGELIKLEGYDSLLHSGHFQECQ